MDQDEILAQVIENDFNVTFTGGDPIYQADALIPLARNIRQAGKTIWCYTGFLYEQIRLNDTVRELLQYIDVLVDGPFIESLRDTQLLFRGSSNQRLIDVARSADGTVTEWVPSF